MKPIQTEEQAGTRKFRVLMIDDDEEEYILVRELLTENNSLFELSWADCLTKGIEALVGETFDVVLLDLFMPDSRGIETFQKLKTQFPDMPIVIMSGMDDERSALDAVRNGAQDFLVKGHADQRRLARVLAYAINRHERQKSTTDTALFDPQTKLYNRRGFMTMAEQHIKLARRDKKVFFVFFAVLNGYQEILNVHGGEEALHSILTTADILGESFRTADILARIGQDEFAIITSVEGHFDPKVISARIGKNQKYYEAQFNRYRLSLSLCSSYIDLSESGSLEQLESRVEKIFQDFRNRQVLV